MKEYYQYYKYIPILQIFKNLKFEIGSIGNSLRSRGGFTLVEIVVAIAVLATLVGGVFVAINPQKQVRKAQDATRQNDIQEIKKALDLYYSDKGCYPAASSAFATALANGSEWKEGNVVYMKKVPLDPSGSPYPFTVDASSCAQWYVTFAKLSQASTVATTCSLSSLSDCAPQGFDDTWACAVSGNVSANCGQITSFVVTTPTSAPVTPSPTATPTPTLAPSPTPTPGQPMTFNVAMNTDPWSTAATINPYPAASGSQQFSVTVLSANPVTSVTVRVATDNKIANYTLVLASGTSTNGVWSGSWTVTDTVNTNYVISPTMTNSTGASSSFDLGLK